MIFGADSKWPIRLFIPDNENFPILSNGLITLVLTNQNLSMTNRVSRAVVRYMNERGVLVMKSSSVEFCGAQISSGRPHLSSAYAIYE